MKLLDKIKFQGELAFIDTVEMDNLHPFVCEIYFPKITLHTLVIITKVWQDSCLYIHT